MFHANHMYKMINPIKDYPWGSRTAIQLRYNIPNQHNDCQAEMWMGSHPNGSSILVDEENKQITIAEFVLLDPRAVLGSAFEQFGELPFLFKILAADKPLSIQVHPSKTASEIGFSEENKQGIPLSSPNRNFKDPNHKPELVYAITPFSALNGFRPFSQIICLLDDLELPPVQPSLIAFIQTPSAETLRVLFEALLNLQGEDRHLCVQKLLHHADGHDDPVFKTIQQLAEFYPDDMGIFAPLLLNVVTLQPGEAMFLYAETPHAYLNGLALEVMANSDNVLRAGLTPKYIDINALINNIRFQESPPEQLLMKPELKSDLLVYPIPVTDFTYAVFVNESVSSTQFPISSASVFFCDSGSYELMTGEQIISVKPGESVFVPAACATIAVKGQGRLMWVSSH